MDKRRGALQSPGMEWRDEGVLLSVRPHGESAAIIDVLTAAHGRHPGVVRGGAGRRLAPVLQPGAQLDLVWKARLEAHLGAYAVEPLRARAAAVLADPLGLAGMGAVLALAGYALPERDPAPDTYRRTVDLLDAIVAGEGWLPLYLGWEMALLDTLGFGLDLSACAVTGATEGLTHVSPRTGRAVSLAGAGNWLDRLLPLPRCLTSDAPASLDDIRDGLRLTGHFLQARVVPAHNDRPLPAARQRLIDRLVRG